MAAAAPQSPPLSGASAASAASAERLVASLQSEAAAERADVFAELDGLVAASRSAPLQEEDTDIALACVSALCGVMCKDAAQVDPSEFQRASVLIGSLTPLDPLRVGSELMNPDQPMYTNAFTSSTSVLGAALAKSPQDLNETDVTVMICAENLKTTIYAAGMQDCLVASRGVDADFTAFAGGEWMPAEFFLLSGGQALKEDDRNMKVAEMTVGMLREARFPPALTSAAWMTACLALAGRPAVAKRMLELQVIELAVEHLNRSGPQQWVSMTAYCQDGFTGWAFCFIKDLIMATLPVGVDITPLLVSSGFADVLVSGLKAIEQVGVANVNAGVSTIGILQTIDAINVGKCLPQIEEMMRGAKSALQFCVGEGEKIAFVPDFGMTVGVFATLVAASLYGTDEEGTFQFKQKDIDGLITIAAEIIRPATYGSIWSVDTKQLRGLLNVCISDRHKALLLNSPGFFPLIIDAALLDPEHPRKDTTDDTVLASIQTDAAECFLQLAAFGPSRERLQQEPAAMETLRALATCGKAFTQECEEKARSALVAIEGIARDPEEAAAPATGAGGREQHQNGHIMMSCECLDYLLLLAPPGNLSDSPASLHPCLLV